MQFTENKLFYMYRQESWLYFNQQLFCEQLLDGVLIFNK